MFSRIFNAISPRRPLVSPALKNKPLAYISSTSICTYSAVHTLDTCGELVCGWFCVVGPSCALPVRAFKSLWVGVRIKVGLWWLVDLQRNSHYSTRAWRNRAVRSIGGRETMNHSETGVEDEKGWSALPVLKLRGRPCSITS